MHLVRYFGVLTNNYKFRRYVISDMTRAEIKKKENSRNTGLEDKPSFLTKSSRGRLLARVFKIDISKCIHCDGEIKIVSSIKDPLVIQKILDHCRLKAKPPPIVPARYKELFVS